MTGKKTRPLIGKLLTTAHRSSITEAAGTSPRSPLDFKILSPRGIVHCDVVGVGLGIVAALEKSDDTTSRSDPIPVNSDFDDEEYTIVTRHIPKNSYTKVYNAGMKRDAGACAGTISLFDISPASDIKRYPTSDFLSRCHLCNKKLHGEDIYMYRGEKAFCSNECRCEEMTMEERREKHCRSEAVSTSNCRHGRIMSTGIFAV